MKKKKGDSKAILKDNLYKRKKQQKKRQALERIFMIKKSQSTPRDFQKKKKKTQNPNPARKTAVFDRFSHFFRVKTTPGSDFCIKNTKKITPGGSIFAKNGIFHIKKPH
jgi:hypothetical protein